MVVCGFVAGIGMVIAHELASLGSRVIIASRSEDKLKAAAEGLNKAVTPKFNVDYVKCNIRDEAEVGYGIWLAGGLLLLTMLGVSFTVR